jgi:glycosyltransferase involved in cell wall biosynthesis
MKLYRLKYSDAFIGAADLFGPRRRFRGENGPRPAPNDTLKRLGNRSAMNLLYFAPHQLWPLTTGARLRDYYLARDLARRCSLTFLEMLHPADQENAPWTGANSNHDAGFANRVTVRKPPGYTTGNVLRGLVGPLPVTVLNFWSPSAAKELARTLGAGAFDVVQIETVQLLRYVPIIRAAPNPLSIVADWHNIESELMRRYAASTGSWPKKIVARRTAHLIERAEEVLLKGCEAHIVPSERERKRLLNRLPNANIHVVPNGVDCAYYSHGSIDQARRIQTPSSKRALLFVGSMDYHANVDAVTWFAREMWPEIARKHRDLEFVIAGRSPAPEVRELASERIRVTGTIDDVRPLYESALAVVVPLRVASGTRLKILEAMAAGVPVVSTLMGAEGIQAQDNVHLLLADSE